MCVKLRRAKFQLSSAKGTFLNWDLNIGWGLGNLMENLPTLGNGVR